MKLLWTRVSNYYWSDDSRDRHSRAARFDNAQHAIVSRRRLGSRNLSRKLAARSLRHLKDDVDSHAALQPRVGSEAQLNFQHLFIEARTWVV
jgi:hypothetical protein